MTKLEDNSRRKRRGGGRKNILGTKGKLDRNTAFHVLEDAADDGPVHGVLKAAADLFEVVFREGGRDAEGFVEVWTADVEVGDLEAAAEHGF